MTPEDIPRLLALASARDNRKPSQPMALAWYQDLGDLDLDIAVEAMNRHYRTSAEYLMPVHIRRLAEEVDRDRRRAAREAREAAEAEAERLALEAAPRTDRSRELAEMIRQTVAKVATPDAALERAKLRGRGMKGRPVIPPQVKKTNAKPIDLAKIPGPEWSDPVARERESVNTLHAVDRPCGRLACSKPTCAAERTRA